MPPPTSNKTIDLTEHISKAKDIGIEDIDVMFEILNKMKNYGLVPTMQQLIDNKDKWNMLAELMKDCFSDQDAQGTVIASTRPECQTPKTEEEKKQFLDTFLQFGGQIKDMIDQNKKDIKENQTGKPAIEPLTVSKAMAQVVVGQKFSESKEKNSKTHEFLGELKALLNSKTTAGTDGGIDSDVISKIDSLMSFYSTTATQNQPGVPKTN